MKRKRQWAEGDGAGVRCAGEFVALLGDPEVRMRSIAISALSAGSLELASDAFQQRLGEEQEISVIEQLVLALGRINADGDISCLSRYYHCPGCPEEIKTGILSSLYRICKSREEHSRLVTELQPAVLQDLDGKNPLLRMWALKFVAKFFPQHHSEGWIISALQKKFLDANACVRKAALDAAIALNATGFSLLDDLHAIALRLLQDPVSETVRISAMELLRLWVKESQDGAVTHPVERQLNYTYLQICIMLTDPCAQAREEACRVLGTMTSVSQKVKLHSFNKKSVLVTRSDPLISCTINGKEPPTGIVAGAFVSAVEDEFSEVRSAAVQALTSLSRGSKELADNGVLGLFLDMLNDKDPGVRKLTIQGLFELTCSGSFSVDEKQLTLIFPTLEDQNEELRNAGRRLLCSMKLPTVSMFESVVLTILKFLERYPQDKKNIYESLICLGEGHSSHVEALATRFLSQVKVLMNEKGLDDPQLKAILKLWRPATSEIPSLPKEMLSCARILDSETERSSVETADCSLLSIVSQVIEYALEGVKNNHQGEAKRVISGCKSSLHALEPISFVNLGLLYLECLALIARIHKKGSRKSYHTDDEFQRLASVLGRMKTCFSGFSPTAALQLLEINAFKVIAQVEVDNELDDWRSELALLVLESNKLSRIPTDRESFPLLKAVEDSLPNRSDSQTKLKTVAACFWPRHHVVSAGIEEMRADLRVPTSNFERRLKFMAGYPYHFTVTGWLHHITEGSRIWVQMMLEGSQNQCRFLDLGRKRNQHKSVDFTEELTFYGMPSVNTAVLRVCVAVELTTNSEVCCHRGPQEHLHPISSKQTLYLESQIATC